MQQGLLSAYNPSDASMPPAQQGYRGLLSRLEERDKVGAGINPYQAMAFGAGFAPSAGISDVLGYAPNPNVIGGTLPSFTENMDQGNYIDAGLQTLGASGDVMLASAPFAPILFAPAVGAKLISQIGKGIRSASKVAPKTGLLGKTNQVAPETGLLGKVDNVQAKTGIAEIVPPTDKADGIMAFHGSPYEFNQFSLSKINTGEKAQAFGNGLYFSSKEDIAKFYRDSVRGFRDLQGNVDYDYKGKQFNLNPTNAKTQEELGVARIIEFSRKQSIYPDKAKEKMIKVIERDIKDNQAFVDISEGKEKAIFDSVVKSYQRDLDAVKSIDVSKMNKSKGHMYQVKLNTVNDDLIDYDKTLGEQNPKIQTIINKLKSEMIVDDAIILGFDPFEYGGNEKRAIEEAKKVLFGKDETVERFMNNWSALRGEQGTAEKLMTKYGAKGIQYLDNASRDKRFNIKLSTKKGAYDHEPIQSGDRESIEQLAKDYRKKGFKVKIEEGGDKNFVIFDDKIIDIMKKYGIVGAVGVTAMQGRGNQSPEADSSL